MNGFLVANKPVGITSSDLVVYVRRRLPKGTAIGHGGTLDPNASGVLPLCIGRATRLFDYIIDKSKTYIAEIVFGATTDTQDATGQFLTQCEARVTESDVMGVLPQFVGDIQQIPPMYSALKRNGTRLYRLARSGQSVELEPRNCHIESVRMLKQVEENRFQLEITCGKGVYIRTICHDIGAALGCGAYMATLQRASAGVFDLAHAVTREEIGAYAEQGRLRELLLPLDAPLQHLPKVVVSGEQAAHAVKNGNVLRKHWMKQKPDAPSEAIRIYLDETFVGIGRTEEDGSIRFRAMLLA